MKRCELCTNVARMYCNSDNASLCYDCDQTVHSANFLVAKHSRTLLCHKCQSPTPWTASGLDLGRTASVCVNCLEEDSSRRRRRPSIDGRSNRNDAVEVDCDLRDDDDELGHGGDRIGDTEEEEDDDSERSDESEDLDSDLDEDAENQVVPWSIMASSPPTTTAGCCSSSEELSSGGFSSDDSRSGSKRERMDADLDSEVLFTSGPSSPKPNSQGISGRRPLQGYYFHAPSSYALTEIDAASNTMFLNTSEDQWYMNPPEEDLWYMDTTATSHMTSNQGFTDGDQSNAMQ